MGLLPKALKTLEILEKPEVIFNRRLKSNPFHPFNNIGGNSKWILDASDQSFTYNYYNLQSAHFEFHVQLERGKLLPQQK